MSADPTVVVPALLAAAGLSPSPQEQAQIIAEYPGLQREIAALHAVSEARYEQPALVFQSRP
ncbi:hypothetical protein [Saccharopolyspora oryzae]|uniref:DUF4089 domain-containing protein n=1 Tax=Saccharopolyspora oryzae TaxID=2997343 RepID=A0ABT4UQK4_9PSEU|nr:hypothetical protein [Saccharopolyspora oryzae]MDA3624005.1 hypothetical protein [Saccharopolyspora oryzae]